MIGRLTFLWTNWAWLSAIACAVLAVIAYVVLGRRWVAYALLAGAALLFVFASFGWFADWRTAIRDQRDIEWQAELTKQRAEEQSKQLAAGQADYDRGLAKAAELAAAATADHAATQTTIEKVIHDSPTADTCRYDEPAAAWSNGLRERPD